MKFKAFFIAAASAAALAGCAKTSQDVQAVSVSPMTYQGLSCSQIATEAQYVANRAAEVGGAQDEAATRDAVATGVAIVLFWPAAFFIGGNDENAAQLAQLKGQLNALEAESARKNCGIKFKTVEVPKSAAPKS